MTRIDEILKKERNADRGGPVTYERVSGEGRRDAMSLLRTGQVSSRALAVQEFLGLAGGEQLSLEQLWVARRQEGPFASSLIVPCAGRTAMIFASPLASLNAVPVSTELIRTACQALDKQNVRMVQALLEPNQTLEIQAFTGAAFIKLAHLLYLRRKPIRTTAPLDLGKDVEVLHWNESHRDLFADAILASYERTLDCPGLLGLRDADDIIRGHMASGRFDPQLWYALHCRNEPIGVMLLSLVPQRNAMELVYLGVALKYRGRGLARKLVEHALGVAKHSGVSNLILAVDEQNIAAVSLYRSMKFVPNARKLAMILTLPKTC